MLSTGETIVEELTHNRKILWLGNTIRKNSENNSHRHHCGQTEIYLRINQHRIFRVFSQTAFDFASSPTEMSSPTRIRHPMRKEGAIIIFTQNSARRVIEMLYVNWIFIGFFNFWIYLSHQFIFIFILHMHAEIAQLPFRSVLEENNWAKKMSM